VIIELIELESIRDGIGSINLRATDALLNQSKASAARQISEFNLRTSFSGSVGSRVIFKICDLDVNSITDNVGIISQIKRGAEKRGKSASGGCSFRLMSEFPEFQPRIDFQSNSLIGSQDIRSIGDPNIIMSMKKFSLIIASQYYAVFELLFVFGYLEN